MENNKTPGNDGLTKEFYETFWDEMKTSRMESVNPFLANATLLYPLKTPENLSFSGVFRGYKMRTLARNGLIKLSKLRPSVFHKDKLSSSLIRKMTGINDT